MMVHTDGTGYHVHNITDFSAGNATVQLVQGLGLSISGTSDIYTNGTNKLARRRYNTDLDSNRSGHDHNASS